MRPSRFLVVMFVVLAVPFAMTGASAAQTVKELFAFSSSKSSPGPALSPAQGRDATLMLTTIGIGRTDSDGAIFKFSTSGAGGILFSLDGTDGEFPTGVTLDTDGNFYGTAANGGASDLGVLFEVTAGGNYTLLYSFSGGSDGAGPSAPPIETSDGNLYGATYPGLGNEGTIYKYTTSGNFSTIFDFDVDASQGMQISSPLLQGADGNLYGTASFGGANGCGTIFKVSTEGTLLNLYSFPCGAGGSLPVGPLIQASNGLFYGTTQWGGFTAAGECQSGCGTVFKMTPSGAVTVLHAFTGSPKDGALALSGLVQGTDGYLYGGTDKGGREDVGILYRITMNGTYTQLYSFQEAVGSGLFTAPLQHTNGMFYGTAGYGGKYNEGSLYSLDVGLGPFVTFVQPTGRVGQTAQILGQSLTGTTSVTFNGVAATSFTVVNDTYMTAVVPSGATTGKVIVTTPSGPLTSNVNFRILN